MSSCAAAGFANAVQLAAAAQAGLGCVVNYHVIARQMRGQRAVVARRSRVPWLWVARRLCRILVRLVLGNALLQILEARLQLFVGQLLRAAAELVARQAKQQKANFLVFRMQFTMLIEQSTQHVLQYGRVVRQVFRIDLHLPMMINVAASVPEFIEGAVKIYPASSGLRGRAGARHSHPSSGAASCADDSAICRLCWSKARRTAPVPAVLSACKGLPHHAKSA
jgi:hypothetical protein